MSSKRIKIGDVFEIPLPDNRKTFGQYVFWDPNTGPLIWIYDYAVSENEFPLLEIIIKKKIKFGPIYTGLKAAIKKGIWKIIGNAAVENFTFPSFVSTLYDQKTGKATVWFLWNGKETKRIGDQLSDRYKNLEYYTVYSPLQIPQRFETGEKPYRDLIETNKINLNHDSSINSSQKKALDSYYSLVLDNDDVSDWYADFFKNKSIKNIKKSLIDVKEEKGYIDKYLSNNAIAAASLVAYLNTGNKEFIPREYEGSINNIKIESGVNELSKLAKEVTDIIRSKSELKDLWQESGKYVQWRSQIKYLSSKLE